MDDAFRVQLDQLSGAERENALDYLLSGLNESERKVVMTKLHSGKITKSFSKMTMTDIKRADGLNLNLENVYPERTKLHTPTLRLPGYIDSPSPSAWLCEGLKKYDSVWAFNTEMACKIIIDAIITESLYYSDANLTAFCETDNRWSGAGIEYTGNVDYMIGSCDTRETAENIDSFLLVVKAKLEWPQRYMLPLTPHVLILCSCSALPQVLAEAGCLLRRRLAAGKNTPVFAVLTNAEHFQFFAIDVDNVVYCSGQPIFLGLGSDGDWASSTSLRQILRWFKWFITSMASISPQSSQVDISQTKDEALVRLRECFGLRSE
jgi:hypothetical protein